MPGTMYITKTNHRIYKISFGADRFNAMVNITRSVYDPDGYCRADLSENWQATPERANEMQEAIKESLNYKKFTY